MTDTRPPSAHRRPHRRPRATAKPPLPVAQPAHLPFEPLAHDATPIAFTALELDPRLQMGVEDRGFTQTTPIQSAVFPVVFEGADLIACAETGTGKTAAFLLPVMQRLLKQPAAQPGTRALVLAPTRELVVQIEDDFQGFSYHTTLTSVAVYGGVDADLQTRGLKAGADIVVATPGRLQDLMNCGAANFERLEVLVLDEADRMMDMGFWPDVSRIVATLPTNRQTLLFSATTSSDVVRTANDIMRSPKHVQVGRAGGPARTITHVAYQVPSREKIDWLATFLKKHRDTALIFVRTKVFADRLASALSGRGVKCAALHADRTQRERMAAVEGFRAGRFKVLVATDIAARGLDIDGIEYVVNYEVPHTADGYVHRVGRTGRAEATGTAVTLVSAEELPYLRAIEKSIKMTIADGEAQE